MTNALRRTDPAAVPDDERLELVMPDSNGVAIYTDVRCPWAHVAVHRLLTAVERAGLEGEVAVDHRAVPLEKLDGCDTDALVRAARVLAEAVPEAGWDRRPEDPADVPASSLRALAHVQAAKATSPAAAVALDRVLRRQLWIEGRDIDDQTVIDDALAEVPELDPHQMVDELDSGRPAAEVNVDTARVTTGLVAGSPTVVLPDGSSWTNPGLTVSDGADGPVIEHDDPSVYDEILDRLVAQRTYD